MDEDETHLARLESPADALRCICGAWRRARNWTTLPKLVTCTRCVERLADEARRASGWDERASDDAHGGHN